MCCTGSLSKIDQLPFNPIQMHTLRFAGNDGSKYDVRLGRVRNQPQIPQCGRDIHDFHATTILSVPQTDFAILRIGVELIITEWI